MTARQLAVIGPFTWEPLVPHLEAALADYGLSHSVNTFGFGRDVKVWSGSDPEFESHPPDGAIVASDSRYLFHGLLKNPRSSSDPSEQGRSVAAFLIESAQRISERHPGIFWIFMTVEPPYPNSADGVADPRMDPFTLAVDAFNARLFEACRGQAGWSVFDRRRVTSLYGAKALSDPRMDFLARFPASDQGFKILAARIAAHWAAVCGKTKKVLALDCDNTLWGGIVGEDGVHGIQLGGDGIGRAYAAFQQALLVLESRGVLLALCSRNNPADVEEVFATHPEMSISRTRIAAASIGWGAKSEGLKSLAATLSLGLDSFVFVDDNPAEREAVRLSLPLVAVPEMPQDPADFPAFGYELGWRYFYRTALSDEDRRKTEQYQAHAHIELLRSQMGDSDAFLRSLGMRACIAQDSTSLVGRNTQLSQKTNQFNLTLRRYTESEMRQMTADPQVLVLSLSLIDHYCDHGWVGLAILMFEETRWLLDSFLMSCRVLGREIENLFLRECLRRARSRKNVAICGEFVPGPKNSQAARFLDHMGFHLVCEKPDGSRLYELAAGEPPTCRDIPVALIWQE